MKFACSQIHRQLKENCRFADLYINTRQLKENCMFAYKFEFIDT